MTEEKRDLGILILCITAAVVFGLAAAAFLLQPKQLDALNCSSEGLEELQHIVVLLDKSEALTERQTTQIRDEVDDLVDEMQIGDRLSIHVLEAESASEAGGLSLPLFSMCKPKHKSQASELTENPTLIERDYKKRFQDPLETALSSVLTGGGKLNSPILEAVYDIAIKEEDIGLRRVIVFSDLLQHSQNFSHYRDGVDTEKLKASSFYERVAKKLRRTTVDLYYLERFDRKGELQGETHQAFWDDYLRGLNARAVTFHYLR